MGYCVLAKYCTSVRADRAALSLRRDCVGARQSVAHSLVTKHSSIGAEAGSAWLRRPHSLVVHGHPVYQTVSLLS